MDTTITAIALADDITIIRAAEFFHRELSKAIRDFDINEDELLALASGLQGFDQTLNAAGRYEDKELGVADSVALVRRLLVTAAQDPHLTVFVEHCVNDWPDDRLAVGRTVSVGLTLTLFLLIATTEVKYSSNDGIEIHKRAVIPKQIQATFSTLKKKFEVIFSSEESGKSQSTPK